MAPGRGPPDPVALEEQNLTRDPDLLPVRRGRMMGSPLTFCRGAAKVWRRTSRPRRQFVSAIRSGKLEAVEGV